jgi:hypothetical protein
MTSVAWVLPPIYGRIKYSDIKYRCPPGEVIYASGNNDEYATFTLSYDVDRITKENLKVEVYRRARGMKWNNGRSRIRIDFS